MSYPTNIVDAAAAIKDGTLGPIGDVKIGDVVVSGLMGISGPDEMHVTTRSIQAGYDITDAITRKQSIKSLEIILANPDFSPDAAITAALTGSFAGFTDTWRDKKEQLYETMYGKNIIEVVTHEDFWPSRVISSIEPLYEIDENMDLFMATVVITEIRQPKNALSGDSTNTDILGAPEVNIGAI